MQLPLNLGEPIGVLNSNLFTPNEPIVWQLILIEVRSYSKLEKCEDFWFSLVVMSRWIGSGAVAVILLLSAVGCSTVPETGRSQFNLISPSMERAMGRDAFTRMKASNTLSQDQNATAMVQGWVSELRR